MNREKSCGAVVFTRDSGVIKYVIVKSAVGLHGFPKGHIEQGETEEETALREIFEEVGLRPKLIDGFKTTEEYTVSDDPEINKTVVYFLAEYKNQEIAPDRSEISSAALMTFDEASDVLEFESKKRILAAASDFLNEQ